MFLQMCMQIIPHTLYTHKTKRNLSKVTYQNITQNHTITFDDKCAIRTHVIRATISNEYINKREKETKN